VSVGITSDAAYLIDKCFDMIVSNEKAFDSKPSVGRIATAIAEVMHDRTEDMASRPFGASLCLFGVDPSRSRPELFEVTPSGACTQRRVVGIGKLLFLPPLRVCIWVDTSFIVGYIYL
jgi:20S proteasome alpha/beta subunit